MKTETEITSFKEDKSFITAYAWKEESNKKIIKYYTWKSDKFLIDRCLEQRDGAKINTAVACTQQARGTICTDTTHTSGAATTI
jgi:hypothetical protein